MQGPEKIPSSDITPEEVYLNRRTFMRAGLAVGSVALTGLLYRRLNSVETTHIDTPPLEGLTPAQATPAGIAKGVYTDEPLTSLDRVSNYNNFYEFTTAKQGVARAAAR